MEQVSKLATIPAPRWLSGLVRQLEKIGIHTVGDTQLFSAYELASVAKQTGCLPVRKNGKTMRQDSYRRLLSAWFAKQGISLRRGRSDAAYRFNGWLYRQIQEALLSPVAVRILRDEPGCIEADILPLALDEAEDIRQLISDPLFRASLQKDKALFSVRLLRVYDAKTKSFSEVFTSGVP